MDAVLVVALVPDTSNAQEDFAKWTDAAKNVFHACVSRAAWAQIVWLAQHPPPPEEPVAPTQAPIASTVYKPHPLFREPDDLDAPIWRYMSFTKLAALLERKSLFFARADCLGDPYEGRGGAANRDQASSVYGDELARKMAMNRANRLFDERLLVYISCWYQAEYESAAMWHIYAAAHDGEGVAVRSSFRRLLESLGGEDDIHAGLVTYLDYDQEWVPEDNLFAPYMHKRHSYEHEREVRALIHRPSASDYFNAATAFQPPEDRFPQGIEVPTDLKVLFEEIRVAPNAAGWFVELVESVVRRLGEIRVPVRQSSMNSDLLR